MMISLGSSPWRKRVIGLVCLLSVYGVQGQGLDQTQIFDLYSEAKRLFRQALELDATQPTTAQGLYRDALVRFERIVRDGEIVNGKLYYNIGNTYFRLGDVGRAILSYRRALRYLPNDPNLLQNLIYARSTRVDQLQERETRQILKTIFFWHYDLATRIRLIAFCSSFGLIWLCALLFLLTHRPSIKWGILVSICLSAAFFGSLVAEEIGSRRNRIGVIVVSEVVARKGDSESYQPSFRDPLHAGTEFKVVEQRPEWLHVELTDGRRTWIPEQSAELVQQTPAGGQR